MIKLIAGIFAALVWIGAVITKHYWPDIDVAGIIGAAQSVLTGLGVYHMTSRQADAPSDKQGGFAQPGLLVALVALSLAGCSLLPAQYGQVEEGAAQVVVQSAERTICRDIPIGTWIRLYGVNSDRVRGWQALCFNPVTTPLNDATVAAILRVYPQFEQPTIVKPPVQVLP